MYIDLIDKVIGFASYSTNELFQELFTSYSNNESFSFHVNLYSARVYLCSSSLFFCISLNIVDTILFHLNL